MTQTRSKLSATSVAPWLIILLAGFASAGTEHATAPPHALISHQPPPDGHDGILIAVKDLIDVKGEITTAGSRHLKEHASPATKDAKCLEIIRRRGVAIVGKTNLSEFAVGVSGSNDYFGTPVNPIEGDRIPGGSSSGSAVAVALGLADVALGTDTAGSIRVPAACCGVSGLKTTFGLISLEGVYPCSPDHLDTIGPLAADVEGLVEGMDLLQDGFRSRYAEAVLAKPDCASIRIGRLYVPETDPAIDASIDAMLLAKGFKVVDLDNAFLEAWKKAQHQGNIVAASGAWFTNKHHRHQVHVSVRAKAAILLGEFEHEGIFKKALSGKAAWQRVLEETLKDVDAIALPVLRTVPPKIPKLEEVAIFEARVLAIQNTVAVNFAGNPALAVPVKFAGADFPVTSVQFIGKHFGEAELLNIGRLAEINR